MSATCANCDAPIAGRYCAGCGQDARARLTFRELAGQAIGGLLDLDSRFWRTLRGLAIPGRMSADYLAGRRIRYMPPVQTYLVVALLFFALVPAGFEGLVVNNMMRGTITAEALAAGVAPQEYARDWLANSDSPLVTPKFQATLSRYSLLMFLTMPVLALMLHGAHLSRRRDYLEHLVVAIHLQTAMFALGALVLALEAVVFAWWLPPVGRWLYPVLTLALVLHGIAACRRVYAEAWWAAAIKYGAAFLAYFLVLLLTGRVAATLA